MVQLFFTFPLFICSSHSWIEIQRPGMQATAPNRKGRVAVSLTTSRRLEFPFGVPYSSDRTRKTFQTIATRRVCGGQSRKAGIFIDREPFGKGTVQILHLCVRKINEKLASRLPARSRSLHFLMLALQDIDSIVFAAITRIHSQESITVVARFVFLPRKNLGRGYFRAVSEGRLGHQFGSLATEVKLRTNVRHSDF